MGMNRERIEVAYDYLRRQLGEASTIRGVILVAGSGSTLAGWIEPERFPAVLLLTGLLLLLLPDDLPPLPALRWPWKKREEPK
jgi:hypothetical protein